MGSSTWNSSLHTNGTRPSEGSSSNNTRGSDIKARPMPAMCWSPPLMVQTICRWRSAKRANNAKALLRLIAAVARARRPLAPSSKFLAHIEVGEETAVLGHQHQPPFDDLVWC